MLRRRYDGGWLSASETGNGRHLRLASNTDLKMDTSNRVSEGRPGSSRHRHGSCLNPIDDA
eukprot:scaffold3881_cov83-Skeletonema_dohrnii-CCMP3373.AAC.1